MPYRFFGRRYSKLIAAIGSGKNIGDYSKIADSTTNHISIVTDYWEKLGLIKKIKKGREIELELTEEGKEWANIINKFDSFARSQLKKIKDKKEV
jgi:DNA-binding MarR family transcriptional regulator